MKEVKILVVGSMNMDVMMYDLPYMPGFGESVNCSSYAYISGGKGANQAIAAAKLGAKVTMVGRVGMDANGETLIQKLEEANVETTYVVRDKDAQTGFDPIVVDSEGKYISFVVLGANDCLSPQQVADALEGNEYDMVVMQLEMPDETIYKTYEYAREKNIPVFLDAGPAKPLDWGRLKGIHIISPNEAETKAITGIDVADLDSARVAAKEIYKLVQPQYVILKMGERGSLLYNGEEFEEISSFKVDAVDSTAAGDTFGAALSIRLCQGISMKEALKYASAAAGICVSRKGAQPSIPSQEEVAAFLQSR